ncbi:MAG: hypothetical protein ACR2PY_02205 [Salinispira sp.]
MNVEILFFFAFHSNILIMFLAGLHGYFDFQNTQIPMLPTVFAQWSTKSIHLFVWGFIAGILGMIIPMKTLLLPVFISVFLVIRAMGSAAAGKKYRKQATREVDRIISDPVLSIPVLIVAYTDMDLFTLLFSLISISLGILISSLILFGIKTRLGLENGNRIIMLLLSMSFVAMIFTALQQSFPV